MLRTSSSTASPLCSRARGIARRVWSRRAGGLSPSVTTPLTPLAAAALLAPPPPGGVPALVAHSSTTTHAANASVGTTAQVFMDVSWLDTQLVQHVAIKKYGDSYASHCTVDAAPLLPFLRDRLAETLGACGDAPVAAAAAATLATGANTAHTASSGSGVSIMAAYGYAAMPWAARALDINRALTEEGVAIRNFPATGASPAIAPAVAMAADMVHACAIRGPVDTGVPLRASSASASGGSDASSSTSAHRLQPFKLQPTQVLVAMTGSPVYFPAMVRAMQHDRTVVVASTRAAWGRLARAMLPEQRDVTIPLLLDEVLEQLIVPVSAFRASALPPARVAQQLFDALTPPSNNAEFVLGSAELAAQLAAAGLLKQLRRNNMTLRQLVSGQPQLFTLVPEEGDKWKARVLTVPAAPILPASAAGASSARATASNKAHGHGTGKNKGKQQAGAQTSSKEATAQPGASTTAARTTSHSRQNASASSAPPRRGDGTPAAEVSASAANGTVASDEVAMNTRTAQAAAAAAHTAVVAADNTAPEVAAKPVAAQSAESAPKDVGSSETSEAQPSASVTASAPPASASSDADVVGWLTLAASKTIVPSNKAVKENIIALATAAGVPAPRGGKKALLQAWKDALVGDAARVAAFLRSTA